MGDRVKGEDWMGQFYAHSFWVSGYETEEEETGEEIVKMINWQDLVPD